MSFERIATYEAVAVSLQVRLLSNGPMTIVIGMDNCLRKYVRYNYTQRLNGRLFDLWNKIRGRFNNYTFRLHGTRRHVL